MFFSSHVLSDAEALCSRVAILAGGKLMASGRMADLQAFQVRAWELIVANVAAEFARTASGPHPARDTRLAIRRYSLELPLEPAPDLLLAICRPRARNSSR